MGLAQSQLYARIHFLGKARDCSTLYIETVSEAKSRLGTAFGSLLNSVANSPESLQVSLVRVGFLFCQSDLFLVDD